MALKLLIERKDDQLTTAREIADACEVPLDTTAKVLQIMNSAGMLSSIKGTKGGYRLEKPLENIIIN